MGTQGPAPEAEPPRQGPSGHPAGTQGVWVRVSVELAESSPGMARRALDRLPARSWFSEGFSSAPPAVH